MGSHHLQKFREWQQAEEGDLPKTHVDYLSTCLTRRSMKVMLYRNIHNPVPSYLESGSGSFLRLPQ